MCKFNTAAKNQISAGKPGYLKIMCVLADQHIKFI
jgi:hypothetical protein